MKLKTILLASAAAVAFGAATPPQAQAQSVFDGPYGGGWIGYYQFHPHFSGEVDDLPFGTTPRSFDSFANSEMPSGFQGGGFAGYGMTFSGQFYVGAEAEVSGSSASTSDSRVINQKGHTEGTAKVSSGLGYGATARLGYIPLPNWLVYGRIGWGATRFKITPGTTGFINNAEGMSPHGTLTLNGIRWGAGTEYALPFGIANTGLVPLARLEWVHTDYETGAIHGGRPPNRSQVFRIGPNDDAIRFGLVIKFGEPPPKP